MPSKRSNKLESVSVIIRKFRHDSGFSQKKLGALMKVSGGYISKLERGKKYPSLGTLVRIAEALEVSPGDMLDAIAEREKLMKSKTEPDPQ